MSYSKIKMIKRRMQKNIPADNRKEGLTGLFCKHTAYERKDREGI